MTGDDVAAVQAVATAAVVLTWLTLRYRGQQRNADRNAAKPKPEAKP